MGRIPTQKEIDEKIKNEIAKEARLWYKSEACYKTRADSFAKEILKKCNLEKLMNIETIERENYNAKHNGITKNNYSNRLEERIALKLFNSNKHFDFGKIIDYQIPLKNKNSDKEIGKIDLLAYDNSKNILTLLELKKPDSEETLLRAILEIFTYSRIVCDKNLKNSYNNVPPNAKIEKAVLLFKDSYAYKEYLNACRDKENSSIYKLMESLNVKFYGLEFDFKVSEYKE